MKTYKFRSDYGKISITCYNLNDLINEKWKIWSWSKHWKDWQTFLGSAIGPYVNRHKKSKRFSSLALVRIVLREFLTLLMEDLILHNDTYVFPRKLGKIQISYLHPLSNKYKYDIDRQGKTYRPVFAFTKEAFSRVQVQYYMSVTRQWRKMLRDEVKKGHTYELVKYEHTEFKRS